MKQAGLSASFGVDSFLHPSRKGPVIRLDLSLKASQHLIFQILNSEQILFVWVAPPCGTSSRAREIALNKAHHGPPMLRNDEYPDGIPDLTEAQNNRVQSANVLYDFVAEVCIMCKERDLAWAVENPFSSLFWRTTFWNKVQTACNPRYVHFHSCMFGAARKKCTTLAFLGIDNMASLHRECDNRHEHKPWGWSSEDGSFATALEVSYPAKLCKEVAKVLKESAQKRGFTMTPLDMESAAQLPETAEKVSRALAAEGTTRSSLPNFVPEYRTILKATIPRSSCAWQVKDFIPFPLVTRQVTIPEGARLLDVSFETPGAGDNIQPASADCTCTFGVPWSPREFMKEAADRGHPASSVNALPKVLKDVIWETAADEPAAIAERRSKFFRKWMSVASEIHEQEKSLKEAMDPHVLGIVKDKKITLLSRMIQEYQLNDTEAPKLLSEGVDLTGEIPVSNDLPRRYAPASVHEDELEALAPVLNDAAVSRALGASDDLSKEVWEKTVTEVSRGWLKGPMEVEDQEAPELFSNRFGVRQKEKVRCVDDMSASMLNATTFAEERISLHSADVMASAIVEWCDARDEASK